ncbi:MAG TPA: SCO family protein [Leptospiraceae bacterium]|nr:SCO family protein [Leptospiraceae bacterium]HMW05566.1 SCO family protein [Leptospiraceae bacterium]HMX32877.1 SCO family protein [Leptospiraceae bacterium]HMY31076.1 SCO family protein [Leptospiraceae bacterium]HMZ65276.1 SCO family protein [Leptospiraceae bacterium]
MILKCLKTYLVFSFLFHFFSMNLFSYDPSYTQNNNEMPSEIVDMKVVEKLGKNINLNLKFKDENANEVTLQNYFKSDKPVFLTIIYYKCPTLCNFHLNGISKVFKSLDWSVGKEFEFVAVSMDPKETPELAAKKKDAYLTDYKKSGTSRTNDGWHFLTGEEPQIKELADSLGFKYKWNAPIKQWIHPAVAYIITPEGKISRYLHGIEFGERDLKLSLVDASNGKIGNFIDKFALFCFQFDPNKNKYTLYAYNIMRIGGAITVVILGAFLFAFWRLQMKNTNTKGEF